VTQHGRPYKNTGRRGYNIAIESPCNGGWWHTPTVNAKEQKRVPLVDCLTFRIGRERIHDD